MGDSVLVNLLSTGTVVAQSQSDSLVQICQFAEAGRKDVIIIHRNGEYLGIRMERYDGAGGVRLADYLDIVFRLAFGILLDEHLAFTVDLSLQIVRQGVDAGHADTMQTAGHLIAVLAELTAGMEDGQNHLEGGTLLLLVHTRRDTAAIICNCD